MVWALMWEQGKNEAEPTPRDHFPELASSSFQTWIISITIKFWTDMTEVEK